MDRSVLDFLDQAFENMRGEAAVMHQAVRSDLKGLHQRFDHTRDQVRAELADIRHHQRLMARILHHVLTQGPAMDHTALLVLAKQIDAKADTEIDGAVSRFEDFETTHTAYKETMDDVGDVLTGLLPKLDRLSAIKAPDVAPAAPALDAPASTSVTVSADTPAGSTVVPVSTDAPVAVGSTVSSPAVPDGTTVVASDPSSVTLSQATTDDHSAGDTMTVTAPAAS